MGPLDLAFTLAGGLLHLLRHGLMALVPFEIGTGVGLVAFALTCRLRDRWSRHSPPDPAGRQGEIS